MPRKEKLIGWWHRVRRSLIFPPEYYDSLQSADMTAVLRKGSQSEHVRLLNYSAPVVAGGRTAVRAVPPIRDLGVTST